MEQDIFLEGAISVKAALEAERREIYEIITDKRKPDRNRNYILRLARNKQIPVTSLSEEEIAARAGGNSHGGLLARVGERRYEEVDTLLSHPLPFLALLEGIEDPYNFGGALRSLYAAGVTGVLVPERNWCNAAGVVTKASAGASEKTAIACVSDWDVALEKQNGREYGFSVQIVKMPFPYMKAI